MLHRTQFLDAIRRTLQAGGLPRTHTAVLLLAGTAAQESLFGHYLHQLGGGPALGFFGIEPATERSLWAHYISRKPAYGQGIESVCGITGPNKSALELDIRYQILLARIFYLSIPEPLPEPTPEMLGSYWKTYWNTVYGAGNVIQFVRNYRRFLEDHP